MCIPFEELSPKLKGMERITAERELRSAMQDAHRSLPFVTCNIHRAIEERLEDPDYMEIVTELEEACENMKPSIDQGAQNMFALMLFCAKKVFDMFK